ncbi:AbrB/MazE/SpoVT family DNA-binding domain-containing protein [Alicyclobacillus kakegawensis]|uniref:AbrB/MazE/SpoVT family DNA-binding domain-containing protein n=1 Tax=Alicyclobacillus kakegawensis TaxID=392012 RepID=UPI00082BB432|nr:AbrB/MazE/SpoVT family DNA-binding domain-containing protein [Alicyclobacillus kakegawensis]
MMAIARVTDKFQVTIPGAIREVLNLDGGDRLVFQVKNNGEVTIRTLKAVGVDDLAGTLGKTSSTPTDEQEKKFQYGVQDN